MSKEKQTKHIILQISPTRCTIMLHIFTSLLYMFRASICPSSGGIYCIYATLVFVTPYGWRLVCCSRPDARPRGGVEVQLYSFFNLGARWRWVVNVTPRPLYPTERAVTHCIGGWVGSRTSLDGCGKSRSPDRPTRSESLYRLCCSGSRHHGL